MKLLVAMGQHNGFLLPENAVQWQEIAARTGTKYGPGSSLMICIGQSEHDGGEPFRKMTRRYCALKRRDRVSSRLRGWRYATSR